MQNVSSVPLLLSVRRRPSSWFRGILASYACVACSLAFPRVPGRYRFVGHVEVRRMPPLLGRVSRCAITVGLLRNAVVIMMGASIDHDPNLNLH